MDKRGAHVLLAVQRVDAEGFFHHRGPLVGEERVSPVGIHRVVLAGLEPADDVGDVSLRGCTRNRTGEDERNQRFVDKHTVRLVDNGDVGPELDGILPADDELIAQHVEADLINRAVDDIRFVGGDALLAGGFLGDERHTEAEELHERAYPRGIALGEVIVDGDEVHALAFEREARGCHRPYQCFALAGGHVDDVAVKEPQRRLGLDGKRREPNGAGGGDRQGGQKRRLDVHVLTCVLGELRVAQSSEIVRHGCRLGHNLLTLLLVTALLCSKSIPEPIHPSHVVAFLLSLVHTTASACLPSRQLAEPNLAHGHADRHHRHQCRSIDSTLTTGHHGDVAQTVRTPRDNGQN